MTPGDPCGEAERTTLTRWEQVSHYPTQIARLYDEVLAAGQDPAGIIEAAHVDPNALRSPETRVSLGQILAAYKVAASLPSDPGFAFLLGTRNRVSYYGMYGFAVMSAPDMGTMLDFIMETQELAANLVALRLDIAPGTVQLLVDSLVHQDIDATLNRFLVEELLGLAWSAFREMVGDDFSPTAIRLTFPPDAGTSSIAETVGVPVLTDQEVNAFEFDSSWLAHPLRSGNVVVHSSASETCASLLGSLHAQAGTAYRVGEVLVAHHGRTPPIEEVGAELGMSGRDLRRKLSAEGSGFRTVCDDVRCQIAMRYLRDTVLAVEHIATSLGFDNAANFRRAFRRWTGKTPTEYRAAAGTVSELRKPPLVCGDGGI